MYTEPKARRTPGHHIDLICCHQRWLPKVYPPSRRWSRTTSPRPSGTRPLPWLGSAPYAWKCHSHHLIRARRSHLPRHSRDVHPVLALLFRHQLHDLTLQRRESGIRRVGSAIDCSSSAVVIPCRCRCRPALSTVRQSDSRCAK